MTELYTAVEKEAKEIKHHKAMMRDKERTVNRLRRQLRLVSESGNRRLNSTQNSLQSNQQILAEFDEYESFTPLQVRGCIFKRHARLKSSIQTN